MKLERREDGTLWITELSLEELPLLALGALGSEEGRRVLLALLRGERVVMPPWAAEYRRYRRTAPGCVYRRFAAMERELRAMGVVYPGRRKGGGKRCW